MTDAKAMVSAVARKFLPMELRNRIRPYWHRLILPNEEKRLIEEIKTLGPEKRWPSITKQEIIFWQGVLDANNHDPNLWPETRSIRTDPEMPLQGYLAILIDTPPQERVKILDVGAGPLTSLGKKLPGCIVEITPIDPNAVDYNLLLQRLGIDPPRRTIYGVAEEIPFPPSSFDLVHARNSIDHTADALKAVQEMFRVVKIGHCVYLNHKIREGRTEKYMTNHQWDFFPKRGRFYIERPGMAAVDIGHLLGNCAQISIDSSPDGSEWFSVIIRRSS
jgi:SAM-dependent methyltransferase